MEKRQAAESAAAGYQEALHIRTVESAAAVIEHVEEKMLLERQLLAATDNTTVCMFC